MMDSVQFAQIVIKQSITRVCLCVIVHFYLQPSSFLCIISHEFSISLHYLNTKALFFLKMEKWATWKLQLPQLLYFLRLCITVRWEVDKSQRCLDDDEMCSRAFSESSVSVCAAGSTLLFYTFISIQSMFAVHKYLPPFYYAHNINIQYKYS